ncbi:MAG TPA: DUF72 domain-containing protein [Spirochaetales bacterium]|nr:DUF72 domain-containing protein [Spirochaetales bacterium]
MAQGRFYVGTSGFMFNVGKDAFYPKELESKDFLRYYSLVFPFVELETSWASGAKSSSLLHMVTKTNPDFLFALRTVVKEIRSPANGDVDGWQVDVEGLQTAASILTAEGRLATIVLRLPHSFVYTERNRLYLSQVCSSLDLFPLAVEFGNDAWIQERVLGELARRRISCVIDDGPEFDTLTPNQAPLTGDFGYFRFEGKTRELWWDADLAEEHGYAYTAQELKKKAFVIDSLTRKAKRVFIVFANKAEGDSTRNARKLAEILRGLAE